MDKTGHEAESCNFFFFTSTIFKYSSSLSAHIALCPGSLGKMSSSKAVCQVCQVCFSELFQIVSPLFYAEHCFFHEISHTKCVFFQKETPAFHQSCLKTIFHSRARCSVICLSRYSPPWGTAVGLCMGSKQPGHTWSPPMCVQGQWVMLTALSPSLVVLMSVLSGSRYLHLSFFSPPLLIFTGTLKKLSYEVRGHVWSPSRNNSGGISWILGAAFLLFFRIAWRMPIKQGPTHRITFQRSASTAELLSGLPIPHILVTTLPLLLKNYILLSFILKNWVLTAVALKF